MELIHRLRPIRATWPPFLRADTSVVVHAWLTSVRTARTAELALDLPHVAGLGQQGDRGGSRRCRRRRCGRSCRPPKSSTPPSRTSWTAHCCRAGRGPITPSCTRARQDHRHEPSGRGQPRRRVRLDLRPGRRLSPRRLLPRAVRALLTLDPGNWTGGKATWPRNGHPIQEPPKESFSTGRRRFNSAINDPAVIEQVVSTSRTRESCTHFNYAAHSPRSRQRSQPSSNSISG